MKKAEPSPTTLDPATSVFATDPIQEIEHWILEAVASQNGASGQRILSRPKLVKILGTTPSRVQQAISRLKTKGYVCSRQGAGVFLTRRGSQSLRGTGAVSASASPSVVAPLASFPVPHIPVLKRIRVSAPVGDDPRQIRMWERASAEFQREFPFLRVALCFDSSPKDRTHDLGFHAPASIHQLHDRLLPLNLSTLAKGGMKTDELCAGALELGKPIGRPDLFALPVLRVTTMFVANRDLLERFGLAGESIGRPGDLLRLGSLIEERSAGHVFGFNYPNFTHYGALYGITVEEQEGRFVFDRDRVIRYLEELKPHIRPHHLQDEIPHAITPFCERRLGVFCTYTCLHPALGTALREAYQPMALPVEPGGFPTEGPVVGAVARESANAEESMLLLGFLASERGQRALVGEAPEWLAVHRGVLEEQGRSSPFPPGCIRYEFDLRSCYTQRNPRIFWGHGTTLNTETAKFFLGLQTIDETLDRMARP